MTKENIKKRNSELRLRKFCHQLYQYPHIKFLEEKTKTPNDYRKINRFVVLTFLPEYQKIDLIQDKSFKNYVKKLMKKEFKRQIYFDLKLERDVANELFGYICYMFNMCENQCKSQLI